MYVYTSSSVREYICNILIPLLYKPLQTRTQCMHAYVSTVSTHAHTHKQICSHTHAHIYTQTHTHLNSLIHTNTLIRARTSLCII